MSNDVVIKVDGLSKRYRLGELHKQTGSFREKVTTSFRHALRSMRSASRPTPSANGPMPHACPASPVAPADGTGVDPEDRTGALNPMPSSSDDTIWALKDVSFEVTRGEIVGIIGSNGAGKSTLLKILSRITKPTKGNAWINGRVGSLLEVGTGFHPELTGRDNIYLNGAILGMTKAEIKRKFDEIVEFSGIEKFIDTPVKRYSSGMYVRLAFAVAAHLEPEILLVDEVLAVGDAAFQKKCLGKMEDIGEEGRTVLFVSHNMNAIQRLCPKSLMLNWGQLTSYGPTDSIVDSYLSNSLSETSPLNWFDLSGLNRKGTGEARFLSVCYSSLSENMGFKPYSNGPLELSLLIMSDSDRSVSSIAVTFYDNYGTKLINADTISIGRSVLLRKGRNIVRLKIEKLYLKSGVYTVGLWLAGSYKGSPFDHIESAIKIEIINPDCNGFGISPRKDGLVTCSFDIMDVK